MPYDCGYAFVRDPAAHSAAMWVPEYSRRARGFATYAALRSLGQDGVAELVSRCCALAERMANTLRGAGDGIEVLNEVVLDQVLVRFTPPDDGHAEGDGEADSDAWTREVIKRVQDDGTCWLGGTVWHGMAAMRISVINWSTTEADVDRSAAAIIAAAQGSHERGIG